MSVSCLKMTTNGFRFFIDQEDETRVNQYCWYAAKKKADNTYYVVSTTAEHILLHRMLVNATGSVEVDHENGNGLDNRKENLRIATRLQNARNRRKTLIVGGRKATSQYKGVMWRGGKWVATIWYDGKSRHLGVYDSEIDAAMAYDAASEKHHGRFGRKNFPEGINNMETKTA